MEKDYIAAAATLAAAAYPNWNPTRETFEVWATVLPDVSGPQLVEAVTAHIRSSKFPPTVADIKERSEALSGVPEPVALLAWQEVFKAVRTGSRPQVWSYPQTAAALDAVGGLSLLENAHQKDRTSNRARFCEAFEHVKDEQVKEAERLKVGQILNSGNLRLLKNLNPDKALD